MRTSMQTESTFMKKRINKSTNIKGKRILDTKFKVKERFNSISNQN